MAQIQAGTSYSTGMAVTAANLNAHVNNATLQEGCISAQASSPLVSGTDNILVSNGTALNKTTLASIVTPLGLFDKNQAQTLGQNVSFASGAILTLGQDPVSALQAVPKQYVDNGFLSKSTGGLVSGSISMIGTSSILTLSANPINALQAATKDYVDSSSKVKAWVNFNGTGVVAPRADFNVTSITDNGTGDYTVNFESPMPNANYSVAGLASRTTPGSLGRGMCLDLAPETTIPLTTTSVRVRTISVDSDPSPADAGTVTVQIIM